MKEWSTLLIVKFLGSENIWDCFSGETAWGFKSIKEKRKNVTNLYIISPAVQLDTTLDLKQWLSAWQFWRCHACLR